MQLTLSCPFTFSHAVDGIVKSAVIDCDAWGSFCHKNGITGYPLIRFYGSIKSASPNGHERDVKEYDEEYTSRNIANWVTRMLVDRVIKLSPEEHASQVLEGSDHWYARWMCVCVCVWAWCVFAF